MNNVLPIIQMLKNGGNPQNIIMNILQQNSSPMTQNLISMINNKDINGVEQFARNLAKSKGLDADELMKTVQSQYTSR